MGTDVHPHKPTDNLRGQSITCGIEVENITGRDAL
jgi:hypothetical protein